MKEEDRGKFKATLGVLVVRSLAATAGLRLGAFLQASVGGVPPGQQRHSPRLREHTVTPQPILLHLKDTQRVKYS